MLHNQTFHFFIKADAHEGELQIAEIGSKGVGYAFDAIIVPSTCLYNTKINNLGYVCVCFKIILYTRFVDRVVNLYLQRLSSKLVFLDL
jgi:hypothetical protein